MSAEIPYNTPAMTAANCLQWGRALMSAEMIAELVWPRHQIDLQWGRALMSAEIVGLSAGFLVEIIPSMGPRSDERGNLQLVWPQLDQSNLQWGRALMSAEIRQSFRSVVVDEPSMGPRSDERGNNMTPPGVKAMSYAFNGAAL